MVHANHQNIEIMDSFCARDTCHLVISAQMGSVALQRCLTHTLLSGHCHLCCSGTTVSLYCPQTKYLSKLHHMVEHAQFLAQPFGDALCWMHHADVKLGSSIGFHFDRNHCHSLSSTARFGCQPDHGNQSHPSSREAINCLQTGRNCSPLFNLVE